MRDGEKHPHSLNTLLVSAVRPSLTSPPYTHTHISPLCLPSPVVPDAGAATLTSTVGLRWEPAMLTVAVALPSRKERGRGGASCMEKEEHRGGVGDSRF